jgi:GTP 3',8-cyclase
MDCTTTAVGVHEAIGPTAGEPSPGRAYAWSMASSPTALVDPFGRRVEDLRLSVTDRCNFRCTYCMPAEGLDWLPRSELLTYEELARIAQICVERWAFSGIRVTGGEPTVRAHLPRLFEMLTPLGVDLAMTTNGVRLPELASALAAAGLRRVNVSLDSLKPDVFERLTRRPDLDKVLAGIDAALAAGLGPVKVNCVVMRGVNDDEVVDLAAFGRARGVGLRFIEFMPLDADGGWDLDQVVPAREILERIDGVFPLDLDARAPLDQAQVQHVEPAARFRYRDGGGDVGVIASVTEPFCGTCDRVRLTAEGKFRTCLFALEEFDLRMLLRAGASDEEIAATIERAVGTKWSGHHIARVDFVRPPRSMSQIGG